MKRDRLSKQLEFLFELDKVKQILRNSILMDSSRRENDAEHSWHMAVAAMLLEEYSDVQGLDMLRVLKMVLVHDVVEIDAGDTFAYAVYDPADKLQRERAAADRIFGMLPSDQAPAFGALWEEFEEGDTPEARWARAVDRIMPILHNYKTEGTQWRKHGVTSDRILERNKGVAEASVYLWAYVQSIVADSVEKGYLER